MTVHDIGGEFRRKQEEANRAKSNGAARPPRELDTVWADGIDLDLAAAGLVDGILPATGMTVIYGPSGCGKTFVVVDLACHVAAGLPWRGYDVDQGVVVYVAAEAPKSVERRVWAWKRHHGVEHLPVLLVRSTIDLLRGDADALIDLIGELRGEHGRVVFVVIDTLARAMVGNENAPEDMGAFVAACGRIREACEGHVLAVHHCGKDEAKGARGWSGLRAATDVEAEVSNGTVRLTKTRDGRDGLAFGFRLEEVELGQNVKGRTVTTCVAVETDGPASMAGKRKLGPNEKVVFDALTATVSERPDEPPLAADIPRTAKGATVERWQAAAMRYLPQREDKRRIEAFNRAMTSLMANGNVRHAAGFAWLA